MQRITLDINGRKVVCFKNTVKHPKGDDLIILPGACTVAGSYITFIPCIKNVNTILIHTPLHGGGDDMSEGPAITTAHGLVDFYLQTIKKLVKSKIATAKVNVLGYSLGGMTLFRLVGENLLKDILGKAVFMNTAYKIYKDPSFFTNILGKNVFIAGTYTTNKIRLVFNGIIKKVCKNIFVASPEACDADIHCAKDFSGEKDTDIKIETPSLYIATKNDNIFPPSITKAMFGEFLNITVKFFKGGHKAYINRAFSFAKSIDEFLAS